MDEARRAGKKQAAAAVIVNNAVTTRIISGSRTALRPFLQELFQDEAEQNPRVMAAGSLSPLNDSTNWFNQSLLTSEPLIPPVRQRDLGVMPLQYPFPSPA